MSEFYGKYRVVSVVAPADGGDPIVQMVATNDADAADSAPLDFGPGRGRLNVTISGNDAIRTFRAGLVVGVKMFSLPDGEHSKVGLVNP